MITPGLKIRKSIDGRQLNLSSACHPLYQQHSRFPFASLDLVVSILPGFVSVGLIILFTVIGF
jgi:hypothetical protein